MSRSANEASWPREDAATAAPRQPVADHVATGAPPVQFSMAKRVVDIVGALSLMGICAPISLIIAAAIRIDSRGPVIYRQERVGLNRRWVIRRRSLESRSNDQRRLGRRYLEAEGLRFDIYKFRTMVADAEHEVGPTWALKDDPRITRVGAILRATRLDEIPQLWNVLRGDMSLVGPRPERPFFVNRFARHIPHYRARLRVPPGITGLAQVEHRYDASEDDVRQKLEYDLAYIRSHSIFKDFGILARTVVVMITRRGAQ